MGRQVRDIEEVGYINNKAVHIDAARDGCYGSPASGG